MAATMTHPVGAQVRLPTRTAAFRSTPPRPAVSRIALTNTFLGSRFQQVTIDTRSNGNRRVTTMAAKVVGKIKLALEAGKANPAPPVGPALGARGVNIMAFCKEYNAATAQMMGNIVPVEITVYDDRSFTIALKTPPASVLLKKAAGIKTGSGKPNREKVGQVTRAQILEVATTKLPDTNANDIDACVRMVEGTAKNMGIVIVD